MKANPKESQKIGNSQHSWGRVKRLVSLQMMLLNKERGSPWNTEKDMNQRALQGHLTGSVGRARHS